MKPRIIPAVLFRGNKNPLFFKDGCHQPGRCNLPIRHGPAESEEVAVGSIDPARPGGVTLLRLYRLTVTEAQGRGLVQIQPGQPRQKGIRRLQQAFAGLRRQCLQGLEGYGVLEMQVADAGAPQRDEVAATSERIADILRKGTHIGSFAAIYFEIHPICIEITEI